MYEERREKKHGERGHADVSRGMEEDMKEMMCGGKRNRSVYRERYSEAKDGGSTERL